MLTQVEDVNVRLMVRLVPRPERLRDAAWQWLARHWNMISALGCTAIAAVLLATATLPSILAPFVLGPLGTIIVTAVIAPKQDVAGAQQATADAPVRRRSETAGHSPT